MSGWHFAHDPIRTRSNRASANQSMCSFSAAGIPERKGSMTSHSPRHHLAEPLTVDQLTQLWLCGEPLTLRDQDRLWRRRTSGIAPTAERPA
jgi:hypothetical protein